MQELQAFVRPELLILIPVLYFIGIGLKKSSQISDRHIPLILGVTGIALSALWVGSITVFTTYRDMLLGIFTALTQGILCAGASVYVNQLIKQKGKAE